MYDVYTKIDPSEHITIDETLVDAKLKDDMASKIKEEVRKNLRSNLWEDDLPEDWADEIKITYDGPHLNISFSQKIKAHEEGVDPHPMNYLYGRVIPIESDKNGRGRPVFRKCTPQSLAQGKWWHSGMSGKGFIQSAVDEVVQNVDNILGQMHEIQEMRGSQA